MTFNQNYCLTKLLDHSQLFGDRRSQINKFNLVEEDKFVGQTFKREEINLPNTVRSTHSYIVSSDGKLSASIHNDYKIYVTDLQSGKVVNVLGKI